MTNDKPGELRHSSFVIPKILSTSSHFFLCGKWDADLICASNNVPPIKSMKIQKKIHHGNMQLPTTKIITYG